MENCIALNLDLRTVFDAVGAYILTLLMFVLAIIAGKGMGSLLGKLYPARYLEHSRKVFDKYTFGFVCLFILATTAPIGLGLPFALQVNPESFKTMTGLALAVSGLMGGLLYGVEEELRYRAILRKCGLVNRM